MGRFFEPLDDPTDDPDRKGPLRVGLEWPTHPDAVQRATDTGKVYGTEWRMDHSIGWEDPVHGVDLVGPVDRASYFTDLASTPNTITWLVPAQGIHFPAILLHDLLVVAPGEPRTHTGPPVSRLEADRIMRDAMRDLGTGLTRRWLAWVGAVLATLWQGMATRRTPWRVLIVTMLGILAAVGIASTLHVFGWVDWIGWLGDRAVVTQVLLGSVVLVAYAAAWTVIWAVAERLSRTREEAAWWGPDPPERRTWQLGRWAFLTCVVLSSVVIVVALIVALRAVAVLVDRATGRLSPGRDAFERHQAELATGDAGPPAAR